jgi:hypothetical protein
MDQEELIAKSEMKIIEIITKIQQREGLVGKDLYDFVGVIKEHIKGSDIRLR